MDAKTIERIGMRTHVKDTPEMLKLILDDAINNVQVELEKEGHTGKLGSDDGVLKFNFDHYKGFKVEIYGLRVYQSDLDIIGSYRYVGLARSVMEIKGKKAELTFDTEASHPQGFDDERSCGQFLYKLIDTARGQEVPDWANRF